MCGDVGLYARTAMPLARPGARRPRSVAATAGVRMGMRAGRRVLPPWFARGRPGGRRTILPARRHPGASPRPRHRDADAQPARPWRGCAGRYFRLAGLGGITRFAPPRCQPASLAARGPSPRPPAGGWKACRGEGNAVITYTVPHGGLRSKCAVI